MIKKYKMGICVLFLFAAFLTFIFAYMYQTQKSGGEDVHAATANGLTLVDNSTLNTSSQLITLDKNVTAHIYVNDADAWGWRMQSEPNHPVHMGWRLYSKRPDGRTDEGDWIITQYHRAGYYKGELIDIEVAYFFPDNAGVPNGPYATATEMGFGYNNQWPNPNVPTLNFNKGFTFYNTKGIDVKYSFYKSATDSDGNPTFGAKIPITNCTFTWGSLNRNEGVRSLNPNAEYCKVAGGIAVGKQYEGAFTMMNDGSLDDGNVWVDEFDSDTFWMSAGTTKVKSNASLNYEFKFHCIGSDVWNAPSLGWVGASAEQPTKYIIDENQRKKSAKRYAGQTLTYEIDQPVETLGYFGTGMLRYSNFSFSDTLPSTVTYKNAKVVKRKPGSSDTDVTSQGTLSYNSTTREVKFIFNSSYLASGMELVGESYVLVINTEVKSTTTSRTFYNNASTTICNTKQTTNTVSTKQDVWYVSYNNNSSSNPNHQTGEFTQNTVTSSSGMSRSLYQMGVKGKLRKNDFVRTGYTFTGWNTKADGTGTSYSDEYDNVLDWTTADETVTLYAQWRKKLGTETITVTDEKTGGYIANVKLKLQKKVNGVWTDIETKTTNSSGKLTMNDLHWFDYRWTVEKVPTGYKTSSSNTTFTITYNNLTASNTVVLRYIQYLVRYHANGGSEPDYETGEFKQNVTTGSMADSEYVYDIKGTLRKNTYKREGYTFTGWNTKADGTGTSYSDEYGNVLNWSETDGDIIPLYAQWKKKLGTETITVTDEITGNPVANVSLKLQKKVNGTWTDIETKTTSSSGKITVNNLHWFQYQWVMINVPTGYRISSSNPVFTITYNNLSATNAVTLYRIHYFVRYHTNGNSEPSYQTGEFKQNTTTGIMADSNFIYGIKGTLRKNTYKREGYTFTGWNTKADGTGTSYSDEYDNVFNWSSTDNDVITLYAQWKKKLGTETITVVSEETGNPVSNVTMQLQKNVNGTWTNVTTGITSSGGEIQVSNLHWFDYRWVITNCPTGYIKSSNTTFTITYNQLSAVNQVILYMKRVTIILNSQVDNIIKGENAPAFLYQISGNDVAGVKHEYNVLVQTQSSTKKGTNQVNCLAGTYKVTQVPVSRYVAGTARNVSHATIDGINASVNVLNYDSAEVTFPYTLTNYGWYYGTDSRINHLTKSSALAMFAPVHLNLYYNMNEGNQKPLLFSL